MPMTEYLRVTTIQTNLFWEDKNRNLVAFEVKIKNIKEQTDIVVLPEMFSTGFSMKPSLFAEKMNGDTVNWMKKIASDNSVLLIGSIIIEEEGKFLNRLLAVYPDGTIKFYDKKHLFALGGEHEEYSAGNQRLIINYKGWSINPLICYDLRFPVWARNKADYDVQVYVANWPAKRSLHWNILLQARAIENQAYVIGVNRIGVDGRGYDHSGNSCVFDPAGIRISTTKANEEKVETIALQKSVLEKIRKSLPFSQDSDDFVIV